jgi:2-polyprenyl-3-methyl-5-hydroxy-6-metoxy-1,4-benzoquinol methylase
MSVLDIVHEISESGYTSANLCKWQVKNRLYQRHLELYLSRLCHRLHTCHPLSVLDVGCAEGIVCRALQQRGWQSAWTGCDSSANTLRIANRIAPQAQWTCGDANNLPFSDKSFDLILCAEVLEHLPHPERALREMARVSRRWLLLSVPAEPLFRTLAWISRRLQLGGDPGHLNFWTAAAFRSWVSQIGTLTHWERTTIYQIAVVELPQLAG